MISNQILQNTIDGVKGITKIDLSVVDADGNVLAETAGDSEDYCATVKIFADSPADSQAILGYQFFKVYDESQLEYIVVAKGEAEDVYMIGKIVVFQIQNLLVAYKERYDKDNFIKNLLLDNLLLVDIFNRAKKLHIETNVKRVVFLIETKNEKDTNALETMRSLFSTKTKFPEARQALRGIFHSSILPREPAIVLPGVQHLHERHCPLHLVHSFRSVFGFFIPAQSDE